MPRQTVPFREVRAGEEFLAERDRGWTRFRKIASLGAVLGEDLAEMNVIQIGGGNGLLTVAKIEDDEFVGVFR